jgi:hypothetical protein
MRQGAAAVLAEIGRPAKAAVPALVAALWDDEPTVRDAAATALNEIPIQIVGAGRDGPPPIEVDTELQEKILDLAVQHAITKLDPGEIVYNPPARMQVGVEEPITVRIARGTFEGDLRRDLVGRGLPQVEKIKVGTFMRAELAGPDFRVTALGDRDRVLAEATMQEWRFNVLPVHSGERRILELLVSVRIQLRAKEELYSFPSFHREIIVDVNPSWYVQNFLADNWKFFIGGFGTAAAGLIAFFGKRWFERRASLRAPLPSARAKRRRS